MSSRTARHANRRAFVGRLSPARFDYESRTIHSRHSLIAHERAPSTPHSFSKGDPRSWDADYNPDCEMCVCKLGTATFAWPSFSPAAPVYTRDRPYGMLVNYRDDYSASPPPCCLPPCCAILPPPSPSPSAASSTSSFDAPSDTCTFSSRNRSPPEDTEDPSPQPSPSARFLIVSRTREEIEAERAAAARHSSQQQSSSPPVGLGLELAGTHPEKAARCTPNLTRLGPSRRTVSEPIPASRSRARRALHGSYAHYSHRYPFDVRTEFEKYVVTNQAGQTVCTWELLGPDDQPRPCGYTSKRHLVKRHIDAMHLKIKPFLCEWPGCEEAFAQKTNLNVHMNTHTGETPHACHYEGCTQRFKDPARRHRHMRDVHGHKSSRTKAGRMGPATVL